jgi:hypothetical protein
MLLSNSRHYLCPARDLWALAPEGVHRRAVPLTTGFLDPITLDLARPVGTGPAFLIADLCMPLEAGVAFLLGAVLLPVPVRLRVALVVAFFLGLLYAS